MAASTAAAAPAASELITKFTNVTLLRTHQLVVDDLWLRGSRIIDPAARFWEAGGIGRGDAADVVVDGRGLILAPGYIDLQLNGAFGFDFSNPQDMNPSANNTKPGEEDKITQICRGVLRHGVTSLYATIITSAPSTYAQLAPLVKRRPGSARNGAHILGLHLEGPFITVPGAHPPPLMRGGAKKAPEGASSPSPSAEAVVSPSPEPLTPSGGIRGLEEVHEVYGRDLSEVGIITLAPEIPGIDEVVRTLSAPPHNIVISAGHSRATYAQSVAAVASGARLVTHLFNAMTSFHHRDPGLIGLIGAPEALREDAGAQEWGKRAAEDSKKAAAAAASSSSHPAPSSSPRAQAHVVVSPSTPSSLAHPPPPSLFYSLIVDGHHTHRASVAIAYASHPRGAVLVTDAMLAMGLQDGDYRFGEIAVRISNGQAHVAGTNTLAGSIATMAQCVQNFRAYTGCSIVEALEAASLHPAQAMRLSTKGALDEGMDGDLVLLDPKTLDVRAAWVMGECAWKDDSAGISITETSR